MAFFRRRPDLQKLMEREDVQGLIRVLRRAGSDMRAEAVQILADMRDPKATEALMREAERGDKTLRALVGQALKQVDPEQKYAAAVRLLADAQRGLRLAAIGVLTAVGSPHALDALLHTLKRDRDPQARAAAAQAIGSMHDRRGVPGLLDVLEDADEQVRAAAARALGVLGDRAAIDALVRVHAGDPHPEVRAAADEAIAALERPTR
jgi:HEAT repeat protein